MTITIMDNHYYMFHRYYNIVSVEYKNQKNINPLSNIKYGDYLVMTDTNGEIFTFFKKDIASLEISQH